MATSTSLRSSTGIHSDIRVEFTTKEGTYRNVKASEHCRPSKQPLFGKELSPVQVSVVSCKGKEGLYEWIVFNSGKELFFYRFEGVGKVPDLKHPLDKRVYKAPTIPVCHDFNTMTRSPEHLDLVVGFSTGPLQYLNPLEKHAICAFNEDASIDNTRVTCIKWVPGSEHCFVSSHRSGNLYVWTTENHTHSKVVMPLAYTPHKETLDAKLFTVKQKNKCPLLCRWTVGYGPINAFAFSPDSIHIAISSQDGFLRIYDFHKQEIYGRMRSYFGGLLCVCWSPDGKYIVTGGEDDLVTVWSFEHRKVVARGEGHKSYVNAVAFDPHMTTLPNSDMSKSAELEQVEEERSLVQTEAESSAPTGDLDSESRSTLEAGGSSTRRHFLEKAVTIDNYTAYRLGSIGQDTHICLWDLSGDNLKIRRLIARGRSRMSKQGGRPISSVDPGTDATAHESNHLGGGEAGQGDREPSLVPNHFGSDSNLETGSNHLPSAIANQNPEMSLPVDLLRKESSPSVSASSSSSVSSKKEKKRKKDKPKKDKPLKPHRSTLKDPMRKVIKFVGSGFTTTNSVSNHTRRAVGTFETCNNDDIAPKMHEVNLVEPLVSEKISQERLTALVFREDCILTACHEGFISTWARPDVLGEEEFGEAEEPSKPPSVSGNPGINSPKPGAMMDHDVPSKSTEI